MREHGEVTARQRDRCGLHSRRFGFLQFRRNRTIVAGNCKPRRLGLPGSVLDRLVKSSGIRRALRDGQDRLVGRRQILSEILGKSLRGYPEKALCIGPEFPAKRSRRVGLTDTGDGFTVSGRESRHKDQTDYLVPQTLWRLYTHASS
jgi:hypothetical protein